MADTRLRRPPRPRTRALLRLAASACVATIALGGLPAHAQPTPRLAAAPNSSDVHADANAAVSVLVVGERTPWLEMLEAELSLLDLDLTHGHAGAPADDPEADARMREWDAGAMVVAGDPIRVHLRRCDGSMRSVDLAEDPSPGRASLLVAEMVFAHAQALDAAREQGDCAPVRPAGAAETVADETWTRPPLRLAPAHAAGPIATAAPATPEPRSSMRLELALTSGALLDNQGRAGFVLGLAAHLALHPHLDLRAAIRGGRATSTLGSAELGLRVGTGRVWRWTAGGGFALVWARQRIHPAPDDQGVPGDAFVARTIAPGYYLATGLLRRVGAWDVGLRASVVQTRRRVDPAGVARRLGPLGTLEMSLTRRL